MRRLSLPLLVLAAAPLVAQLPLPLAPPVLGYAFDPAESRILRVSGVPGAALFDAAIQVEPRLSGLYVSPAGTHGVASGFENEALLVRWPEGRLSVRALPDGMLEPRAVFSPAGSTAVLYADLSNPVQVWTGLPELPRLTFTRHTGFGGLLTAIAVSEAGDVAIAVTMGGYSRVLLLGDGSGRMLADGGRFSALAFSPDSSRLLAADAEQDRVWVLSVTGRDPSPRLLAGRTDGVAEPVAAAWSRDGSRAFAAERDGKVIEIGADGAIRTAGCDCTIDGLHRLRGEAVFRLVDPPKGRTPVFDGDGQEPRVVFLPLEVRQ